MRPYVFAALAAVGVASCEEDTVVWSSSGQNTQERSVYDSGEWDNPDEEDINFQSIDTELCDYIDNDNDGRVDEGCKERDYCKPRKETCNNVDDDCDGIVDNVPFSYEIEVVERFPHDSFGALRNTISGASWAPDGQRIAFVANGTIKIYDMRTHQSHSLGMNYRGRRISLSYGAPLSWSPRDEKIAFFDFTNHDILGVTSLDGEIKLLEENEIYTDGCCGTHVRRRIPDVCQPGETYSEAGFRCCDEFGIGKNIGCARGWVGWYSQTVSPPWSPDGSKIAMAKYIEPQRYQIGYHDLIDNSFHIMYESSDESSLWNLLWGNNDKIYLETFSPNREQKEVIEIDYRNGHQRMVFAQVDTPSSQSGGEMMGERGHPLLTALSPDSKKLLSIINGYRTEKNDIWEYHSGYRSCPRVYDVESPFGRYNRIHCEEEDFQSDEWRLAGPRKWSPDGKRWLGSSIYGEKDEGKIIIYNLPCEFQSGPAPGFQGNPQ